MTLSKAPYIHRAVIVELDRQDSYTVKNGLYMPFLNWPVIEPEASRTKATRASTVSSLCFASEILAFLG